MSSSRAPQSSSTFVPVGSLRLRDIHKIFKDRKRTSHEERQTTVRVIWDINTCPLRDNDNGFVYNAASLRENINTALHHLSPNLHVEEISLV
ncbi:unnamed protein product [Arabis nemorensis]|uniref:Uncharacterized protein n=1 Tax=Arabis nemorensis TaxID=586526 RepID=A0A565CFV6_9BRAS|nr:unnamed protein product [Arabis nemorensis]